MSEQAYPEYIGAINKTEYEMNISADELFTITATYDGRWYTATYRKRFIESLGEWATEMVPGTLRWLGQE
jgi:hypothetical protein